MLRARTKISRGFKELIFANHLNDPDFTGHSNWDVTGDFDDSANPATLIFNTGTIAGTLIQVFAKLAKAVEANQVFAFTYTVAVTTAPDGDFTLVLSKGFVHSRNSHGIFQNCIRCGDRCFTIHYHSSRNDCNRRINIIR